MSVKRELTVFILKNLGKVDNHNNLENNIITCLKTWLYSLSKALSSVTKVMRSTEFFYCKCRNSCRLIGQKLWRKKENRIMILWPPFSAWLFIIKIVIRIFGTKVELQTLCGIDDSDIEVLNNNNNYYYKYLASFLRCQCRQLKLMCWICQTDLGCKGSKFYSLPFVQAVASMY